MNNALTNNVTVFDESTSRPETQIPMQEQTPERIDITVQEESNHNAIIQEEQQLGTVYTSADVFALDKMKKYQVIVDNYKNYIKQRDAFMAFSLPGRCVLALLFIASIMIVISFIYLSTRTEMFQAASYVVLVILLMIVLFKMGIF